MIVGTAGHIDHGKTALVKALTGIDTDRLKEEKARGITIDLGFASAQLAEGRITGFVDVPGHERLVHTMLAGASGIDLALIVVAVDDGVMPQTREHVAILDLLGIGRCIVALTKADLVGEVRRSAVETEVRALLATTSLDAASILPVSVMSGEGVVALREHLIDAERETPAVAADSRFRLAVDRCFTLTGAGVIVTGTVLSGAIAQGERVIVSPSGLTARVRSLHAQSEPAARGIAGQRCALNLAGDAISKGAIARGDVVLDPALHAPTARIDASLRVLTSEPKRVGDWFPARLHHASAEVGVRIVPLEGPIAPGSSRGVQLVLDKPIAAAVGDRFVLRDVSAQRTIGGGRLLDLRPPHRKRRTPERLAQLDALALTDPADALRQLLRIPPFIVDVTVFARDHALSDVQAASLIAACDAIPFDTNGGRSVLLRAQWMHFGANLDEQLKHFHADNPDLQGMGRERLRLAVEPRLPAPVFLEALRKRAEDGEIVLEGAFVRRPDHEVRLTAADEAIWHRIAPLLGEAVRYRPPRVRDLAGELGESEPDIRRILKLCARLGRVDQIAHDHFFLRATTAEMTGFARDLAAQGEFTAAQFRDRMDNGRKVAIQVLDFFDRHGVTLRRGDLRRINPHRADLFGGERQDGRETFPVERPDFKSGWGSETVSGGFDSHSLPPVRQRT